MNLAATLSVAAVALTAGLLTGTYYTARYKNYQLDSQRIAAMERAVKKEIEIDLDRSAAEIIRLGGDLDRANEQIRGLQAVVKGYLTAASGD